METSVLIPQDFSLAMSPTSPGSPEQTITVWSTNEIPQGSLFYPFQGTIRIDNLDTFKYLEDEDVRYRFGLYDEILYAAGKRVRHCNWIRFLRVSDVYGPQVNLVCTKVNGEPIYKVVKPITSHQELVVYFLPESPEELFFVRMRASLYRQTMDSILEGSPLDLSMSLLNRVLLPVSPSSSEDEHKSISSDSSSISISSLSLNDNTSDQIVNGTSATQQHLLNHHQNIINNNNNTIISNKTPQRARSGRGERSLLPCEVCGKAFDRPSLLKRHMRTHTGEKPHVCLVCGKGFSTSSSLNTHRRIHSGEKPHQCQVCGKRFTASSNLYYHRMTHIKEKPHKCNLCVKSFPTPGDLKSHMYTHTESWPFKCHICARGFSKHTNLKNHLFLHTGEKPFGCELCNKKFALACNLRAHMKTHEGDPQDECVRCGKQFLTNANSISQGVCSKCLQNDSIDSMPSPKSDASRPSTEDESSNAGSDCSDK